MTWTVEESDLKKICKMLHECGVVRVDIEYDGGSGSGIVEGVMFVSVQDEVYGDLILNEANIRKVFWEKAYDILYEQPFDWVEGEGGFGVIAIDTQRATFKVKHNHRVIEITYEEFKGEL